MNTSKSKLSDRYKEIRNNKVFHDFHVEDRYEAGLVLKGTEVKSLRDGKAQITESFVRIDRNRPILYNAHIEPYSFGNYSNHDPRRPRQLLLNINEINKLVAAVKSGGYTIIPLRLYFKHGLAKMEIAICKGKKLHDKREQIKQREDKRYTDRLIKRMR